jgi:threonine dehydratase
MYFIHSANERLLIAGVATYTLEVMRDQPDLDAMIVPVGAGSGVCGAILAGKAIKPDLQVYGVQAAGAPVVADSWGRAATPVLRHDGDLRRGDGDPGRVRAPGAHHVGTNRRVRARVRCTDPGPPWSR